MHINLLNSETNAQSEHHCTKYHNHRERRKNYIKLSNDSIRTQVQCLGNNGQDDIRMTYVNPLCNESEGGKGRQRSLCPSFTLLLPRTVGQSAVMSSI